MPLISLRKEFRFEASHRLPYHEGKCARLHGHSWILEVEVAGAVDVYTGMVVDYDDIKKAVQPLIDDLDHRHLGTWFGLSNHGYDWGVPWLPWDFNSTSENLLLVIAKKLPLSFPWTSLTLHETCTCEATLRKEDLNARQTL